MLFLLVIIIIMGLVTLCVYYMREYQYDGLVKTYSTIDGESYWVRNRTDREQAANTLAKIKINMKKLISHLQQSQNKFPSNMRYIHDLVARTKTINIMESGTDEKYTSYTINKGERIVFCLRSKILGEIHDMNTLMYVVIHEMAHIGCPEYGHTPLFKQIFRFLLTQGAEIGIYKPVDYRIKPQNYCGMTINEYLLD